MSKLHKSIDRTFTVNVAIRFVKACPCSICGLEKTPNCNYKNKGACPIFKSLKQALSVVKEVEKNGK